MDSKIKGIGLNNPELQGTTLPTVQTSVLYSCMEEIDRAIIKGKDFIVKSAICSEDKPLGWGETIEDKTTRRMDPWGCADAILTLLMAGFPVDSPYIAGSKKCPASFIANELKGGVKIYLPRKTQKASIPGTGWCLIAISEVLKRNPSGNKESFQNSIKDASEWLRHKKLPDAGWSFTTSDKDSHIYSTAIAIRGLLASMDFIDTAARDEVGKTLTDSIEWLIDARNNSKLWGRTAEAETSLTHSAHALVALLDAEASGFLSAYSVNELSESADSFLSRVNEHKDDIRGSLVAYEIAEVGIRMYHYDLPWIITATSKLLSWKNKGLMASLVAPLIELIKRLLSQQKVDAFIPTGHQSKPIWATHDGIYALDTFRRSFTTDDILEVFKRKNNLKKWVWYWAIASSFQFVILLIIILRAWPEVYDWVKYLSITYFSLTGLTYIYAFIRVRILEMRDPVDIFKKFFHNFINTLEKRLLGRED